MMSEQRAPAATPPRAAAAVIQLNKPFHTGNFIIELLVAGTQ
jgi:hypothetical protein